MRKILAVLGVLALLGGILAACGAEKPEELLAGKWQASIGSSFEFNAFEFVPSEDDPLKGTVNLNLIGSFVNGSYEVIPAQGKDEQDLVKIIYTLMMFSTTRSYFFTVEGDTLNLQEEGKSITFTYTREAAGSAGTTAG